MAEDAARTEHRPRLGRGLAALLGTANEETVELGGAREGCRSNSCGQIRATREKGSTTRNSMSSPLRSRSAASSSRSCSPIPRVADAYEIIAGERRWRAAQRAGRHDIPVIVVEAGDREALEIAIVENVQRADLNALEEAAGYAQLGADYGYSHGDIARVVGKSRSHVANTVRLTNLPEHTRALLAGGQISAGHARALLAVANPDTLANRIVAEGMTVRDIERFGANTGKNGPISKGCRNHRRRYARPSGQTRPGARDKSDDFALWGKAAKFASPSRISTSSTTSAAGFASRRRVSVKTQLWECPEWADIVEKVGHALPSV